MRVQYTSKSGVVFAFDASTAKEAFEGIAPLAEIFSIDHCEACQSTDIRPRVRENDGFKFYELECQGCRARLAFGQKREGGDLFPKKKDKDDNWLPNNGWVKWEGGSGNQQQPQQKPQPQSKPAAQQHPEDVPF